MMPSSGANPPLYQCHAWLGATQYSAAGQTHIRCTLKWTAGDRQTGGRKDGGWEGREQGVHMAWTCCIIENFTSLQTCSFRRWDQRDFSGKCSAIPRLLPTGLCIPTTVYNLALSWLNWGVVVVVVDIFYLQHIISYRKYVKKKEH